MNDMAGLQKQQLDSFAAQLAALTEKSEKKSDETGNTLEEAAYRSRQLEKKLKRVEALPAAEAAALLADAPSVEAEVDLPGEDAANG